MKISPKKIQNFKNKIRAHYKEHGRSFPWRRTRKVYNILVSEIMLQQTQTLRVIPKYKEFLNKFPNFSSLARASNKSVLHVWQGLGYNRRALYLKNVAKHVSQKELDGSPFHEKQFSDPAVSVKLSGIGPGTAGAIAAFAFNKPVVFIETNIRRVFIHFFFKGKEKILDADILILVEKTLDTKNPRDWYYALMDYGAWLVKYQENPNKRSAHHVKQKMFNGSDRQTRGQIIKILLSGPMTTMELKKRLKIEKEKFIRVSGALAREGFIQKRGGKWSLK